MKYENYEQGPVGFGHKPMFGINSNEK